MRLDSLQLPLSLLADSVTYVFEQADDRRDTLVLCYRRNIEPYRTGRSNCGYVANISGDETIYGRADSVLIRELPEGLRGKSRTTFAGGRVEYRRRGILGPINVFEATIRL